MGGNVISEKRLNDIFEWFQENEGPMAEAKAKVYLLEQQLKSVKADLMMQCNETSSAAKETYALSHKDYKAHIQAIYEEMRKYERMKLKRDTGMAQFEAWRSYNATARHIVEKTR